ncbi:hypothetical protein [Streptomyces sp.]|uniref:hypothetical protein n=1 Tax=Streptomyces sp. TaxID=1931 RepID=UPI002F4226E5
MTTTTKRHALPWNVLGLRIVVLAVAGLFAGRLSGVKHDDAVDHPSASAQSTQVGKVRRTMPGGGATDLVLVHERTSPGGDDHPHSGEPVTAGPRPAPQPG